MKFSQAIAAIESKRAYLVYQGEKERLDMACLLYQVENFSTTLNGSSDTVGVIRELIKLAKKSELCIDADRKIILS